jgi:hypothetical protein
LAASTLIILFEEMLKISKFIFSKQHIVKEYRNFAKKQDQGNKPPPKKKKRRRSVHLDQTIELYQKDIKGNRAGGGGKTPRKQACSVGRGAVP